MMYLMFESHITVTVIQCYCELFIYLNTYIVLCYKGPPQRVCSNTIILKYSHHVKRGPARPYYSIQIGYNNFYFYLKDLMFYSRCLLGPISVDIIYILGI